MKNFRVWYFSKYGIAIVNIKGQDKRDARKKFNKRYKNRRVLSIDKNS